MLRYLLGQTTSEERSEIEERYLSDNDFFEELLALEGALIDEYVAGRMPGNQREQFMANLTASQRRDIEFTGELMRDLRVQQTLELTSKKKAQSGAAGVSSSHSFLGRLKAALASSPGVRLTLAGVATALVVGLPLLFWIASLRLERNQAQSELGLLREQLRQNSETARAENERLDKDLATERKNRGALQNQLAALSDRTGAAPPDEQVVLLDRQSTTRGGPDRPPIKIRQGTKWVRFDLQLPQGSDYQSYASSIRTDQQSIDQLSGLVPRAGKITIYVLADKLPMDDYKLDLLAERKGQEPIRIDTYAFRLLNPSQ